MAILKRKFLVTVLSRDVDQLEFESLADLEREIDSGPHIGAWEQVGGPEVVPDDQVVAELKAINNDGTFFGRLCDDCGGKGTVLDAPQNVLDGRAYSETCPTCDGSGRIDDI